MSWEVFGTSGDDESIGADELYSRGWESDEDAEKWWREEHPEGPFYTFAEAVRATEDWLYSEDI
jgi:hypothetical protein